MRVLIVLLSLLLMGADNSRQQLAQSPTIVRMYNQNNYMRQRLGRPAQTLDVNLVCAAQDHANYMARTGRLDHFSNGGPWARARKYGYTGNVAENIASGQRGIAEVFNDWRGSRGHYKNMISNATRVGVGCQRSSSGKWFWVTLYGH